jgi:hypothetical protein
VIRNARPDNPSADNHDIRSLHNGRIDRAF